MSDETQRLAALYAAKEDEELLALAQDMAELTDSARAALQAEIEKRRLSLEPRPVTPVIVLARRRVAGDSETAEGEEEEIDPRTLIDVAHYRDLHEALLAKGSLDSAGIPAFLQNDNMVRIDWYYSNAVGGISLHVPAEDADAAHEILFSPPVDFTPDTDGVYVQPRCPACDSTRATAPGDRHMTAALLWATNGTLPFPLEMREWRCESCGHLWEAPAPAKAPSSD